MKVNITLLPNGSEPPPTDPPNENPADIRWLYKWSELTNAQDRQLFSSARGQPEGQTQGQQSLYTPYLLKNGVWAGTWSVNQNSPTITNADLQRIGNMQTADNFSVDEKMVHISCSGLGVWGQAIMATYDPNRKNWREATGIRMNQAVYANNPVEVLEYKTMNIDTFGTVPMARIKTGWDCVHVYTAVNAANVHYENVKGMIVLPLLPKAGYEWWILARWLR